MSTRDRILASALQQLQTYGLSGLSLRAAGQQAGVTPMAVYRHFKDKDDLLQAVGEHALNIWQTRILALPAAELPGWYDAMATAFVDFALDEPALFDAAFVLRTKAERIYPEDFISGRSPVVSAFANLLAEGQAQGHVRPGDPLEMAMATWGVLQGLVSLHRSGRFNLSRPDFTSLCLRSAARIYRMGDGL